MDSRSSSQYELKNEMYEYNDSFPLHQSTSKNKSQQEVISKAALATLVVVQLLVVLLLGVILGLTTVIFTRIIDPNPTNVNVDTNALSNSAGSVNQSCTCNCNFTCSAQVIDIPSLIQNVTESISYVRSSMDEQTQCIQNNTDVASLINRQFENATQKLTNIVSTLNNLKSTSISTAGAVDDILLVVEELLEIQNASVLFSIQAPISCKDIKKVLPNSPTGYYHVNSRNIYCNMEQLCGTGGGWTRLAYLDMSDSTVNCPTGFRLYQTGGIRGCGRPVGGASCPSVEYQSNGISYSQICGRVVGYQYGSTNAVDVTSGHNDINSYYVDGVSITRGSPRQHVWTLMAGLKDSSYDPGNCPCNNPSGSAQQVQSFVGTNYFCESGNPTSGWSSALYAQDPLWDGQGCGIQEQSCCSNSNLGLPWFHRSYGNLTTTDYIELRVCGDQDTGNEDVVITFYEIYVK